MKKMIFALFAGLTCLANANTQAQKGFVVSPDVKMTAEKLHLQVTYEDTTVYPNGGREVRVIYSYDEKTQPYALGTLDSSVTQSPGHEPVTGVIRGVYKTLGATRIVDGANSVTATSDALIVKRWIPAEDCHGLPECTEYTFYQDKAFCEKTYTDGKKEKKQILP